MNNLLTKSIYSVIISFVVLNILFIIPKSASADICSGIAYNNTTAIPDACTANRMSSESSCNTVSQNGVVTGTLCCTTIVFPATDYCSVNTTDWVWVGCPNNCLLVPPTTEVQCCLLPTPTPVPCVQGGGSCIASYPCNIGQVPSSLSCESSGVCCVVAPTNTPTPTPTPTQTPTPTPTLTA